MPLAMSRFRKLLIVALPTLLLVGGRLDGAELSVSDVIMLAGTNTEVVVSGVVTDEITYGMTILVEILPRAGNIGSLVFTLSPPVDVVSAGDPWPGAGTFSPFDTDSPGFSDTLNGVVDDDGRFLCDTPVSFAGPLATFPVTASLNASGVWDVVLSTSVGDATWECLTTTRVAGTVTVSTAECLIDSDCDDTVVCTDDTCVTGACVFAPNDANCSDDTVFCNGLEVCDPGLAQRARLRRASFQRRQPDGARRYRRQARLRHAQDQGARRRR